MSTYHEIAQREARDKIIQLLFPSFTRRVSKSGVYLNQKKIRPFPATDLPTVRQTKVPSEMTTIFYLLGGQQETTYLLCDENGVPLQDEANEDITGELLSLNDAEDELWDHLHSLSLYPLPAKIISIPASDDPDACQEFADIWKNVVLFTTPAFIQDQRFKVLLQKTITPGSTHLLPDNYLSYSIPFEVGITLDLPTTFVIPSALASTSITLRQDDTSVSVDYGESNLEGLVVRISKPQIDLNYKVVEKNTIIERSNVVRAQKGDAFIDLTIDATLFEEDTILIIQAFRWIPDEQGGDDQFVSEFLEQQLKVIFRPNLDVGVVVEDGSNILEYGANASIVVEGYEVSGAEAEEAVVYQLYSHQLALTEYQAPTDIDMMVMQFSPLDLLEDGDLSHIADLNLIEAEGEVFATNLMIDTGNVFEDTVFIVQVTKFGESFLLNTPIVLLVLPSPDFTVQDSGAGLLSLSDTQEGVKYQLQSNGDAIGNPGYHYTNRGVALTTADRQEHGMRIETDLVVGSNTNDPASVYSTDLALPTDSNDESTLSILAIKPYTGLSILLSYPWSI